MDDRVTLVLLAQVPAKGVLSFRDYERQVLPLLADAVTAHRENPDRVHHAPLLRAADASLTLIEMYDVEAGTDQ